MPAPVPRTVVGCVLEPSEDDGVEDGELVVPPEPSTLWAALSELPPTSVTAAEAPERAGLEVAVGRAGGGAAATAGAEGEAAGTTTTCPLGVTTTSSGVAASDALAGLAAWAGREAAGWTIVCWISTAPPVATAAAISAAT